MKSYFNKKILFFVVTLFLPLYMASAQSGVGQAIVNLQIIFGRVAALVDQLLPLVFSLAILAFFWGIFRYVYSQSTEDKISGRNVMFWSLVAIFVMASLYGIIAVANVTLGINNPSGEFKIPTIQRSTP